MKAPGDIDVIWLEFRRLNMNMKTDMGIHYQCLCAVCKCAIRYECDVVVAEMPVGEDGYLHIHTNKQSRWEEVGAAQRGLHASSVWTCSSLRAGSSDRHHPRLASSRICTAVKAKRRVFPPAPSSEGPLACFPPIERVLHPCGLSAPSSIEKALHAIPPRQ